MYPPRMRRISMPVPARLRNRPRECGARAPRVRARRPAHTENPPSCLAARQSFATRARHHAPLRGSQWRSPAHCVAPTRGSPAKKAQRVTDAPPLEKLEAGPDSGLGARRGLSHAASLLRRRVAQRRPPQSHIAYGRIRKTRSPLTRLAKTSLWSHRSTVCPRPPPCG